MEAFTRRTAEGGWKACVRFPGAGDAVRVLDGAYRHRLEALEEAQRFVRLVGQLERAQ
jgi:hypothetical protein